MKCPYTVNTLVIEQTQNEYNAEGNCAGYQTVTRTSREYIDCLREDCGAFYDGRCRYNEKS